MRLDPAAGTQLNLAFCHEGEGRTATAWAEYNDALTQARRDGRPEREQFASDRLRGLSSKLMLLAITLAPGAEVPGLEVSLDGAVVGAAALGAASPVDPGTHTLAARAPGFAPWSAEVRVATGDGRHPLRRRRTASRVRLVGPNRERRRGGPPVEEASDGPGVWCSSGLGWRRRASARRSAWTRSQSGVTGTPSACTDATSLESKRVTRHGRRPG